MKRGLKKIIAVALMLSIVACILPLAPVGITARAADEDVKVYGNFAYVQESDGNLTIAAYNSEALTADVVVPATINGLKVTKIGTFAFSECDYIQSVTISNNISVIEVGAFDGCSSLKKVTLPATLKEVQASAFGSCESLSEFKVSSSNPYFSSADGVLYNKNKTEIISCGGSKKGVFTVPSTVKSIASYAFDSCSGITSVTIPKSVTYIGQGAFYNCSKMTRINVNAANPNYKSVNAMLLNKSGTEFLACPPGMSGKVTIPSGVKTIGAVSFDYCSKVTEIVMPSSVTLIAALAFSDCDGLTKVNIPNSVTTIGEGAFFDCDSLTEINIPSSVTEIMGLTFAECSQLTCVAIPKSVKTIGALAFYDTESNESIPCVIYDGTQAQWEQITIGLYNERLETTPMNYRIAGNGRFDTAVEISKSGWKNGSENVVLAYGMNYADALAGAPLAAALDCPLLLTGNLESGLESIVTAEMNRLGVKNVYILGGEYVVSSAIESSLKSKYGKNNVERVYGENRYGTSLAIAEKLDEIRREAGKGSFSNVYFCSAGSFADALSISPVAGIEMNPILYAPAYAKGQDCSLNTVSPETADYVKTLCDNGCGKMTIVGGIYAVSEAAQADLEAAVPVIERVHAGITGGRYDTMLQICRKYDSVFTNKDTICVATGMAFPDALAGAALAAKTGCPLVLVGYSDAAGKVSSINEQLQGYVTSRSVEKTFVFGGIYAVADKQVERLVKKVTPILVQVSLAFDDSNASYSSITGATKSGKSYIWNGVTDVSFKVSPAAGYEVESVKYDTGYKTGTAVESNGTYTISKDDLKSSYDTTFAITVQVKELPAVKMRFTGEEAEFEEVTGVIDNGEELVWDRSSDITFKASAADGYKIAGVDVETATTSEALEPNGANVYTIEAEELKLYEGTVVDVSAQTEKLPVVSVDFAADNAMVSNISGVEQDDSGCIWNASSDVTFEVSASDGYEVSGVLFGTQEEAQALEPDENGVYVIAAEQLQSDADKTFAVTVETSKVPVVTVMLEGENVSFSDVLGAEETESGYVWDNESDITFVAAAQEGYTISEVNFINATETIVLTPDENGVYTLTPEMICSAEDMTFTVAVTVLSAADQIE